ncbi:hypothetical protein CC78DRAFT_612041 [Lojkania enalia]|uniref:Pre-rRNA-processing protein TSR2 n=1 Tax=Lojkania enalia TaxID=147567 RepID=A0A9P4NAK7_9PLEO|nr:hypothetical protein CC78DRAFT_612041 [Didymosphaeria enalia]
MSTTQPAASAALSPEAQAKLDLGIWHCLFNWQALTVAIQAQWGGPDSADKRDWLAGALSEIFESRPETDTEDIEVVLLQALEDEFGARLEDESEVEVARRIMEIRKEVLEGNHRTVDELQKKWEERKGKPIATGNVQVTGRNQIAEWDSVDEESDEEEENEDVDMADAPPLLQAKPKPAPEVDAEGFTKVASKRRK